MPNVNPFYPYQKIYPGYFDLSSTNDIPRRVMDYLLDMPAAQYEPIDDNSLPRCLFWKLLYHDGANPDKQSLPNPAEKMSVLFNPDLSQQPPTEKGFRLIPQIWEKPAQVNSQTKIFVYMGRHIPENTNKVQMSVAFDIWTHYTQEANTRMGDAYSRVDRIEQCIIAAFNGVNMTGVGSFYYDRSQHPDCGSTPIKDNDSNVGRHLVLGVQISSETPNSPNDCSIPLNGGTFD